MDDGNISSALLKGDLESGSGKMGVDMSYPVLASQVALVVKNLLSMKERLHCQSLSWEDPLEKEMEAHSSILAWRVPWMEEPGRVSRVGHDLVTKPPPTTL